MPLPVTDGELRLGLRADRVFEVTILDEDRPRPAAGGQRRLVRALHCRHRSPQRPLRHRARSRAPARRYRDHHRGCLTLTGARSARSRAALRPETIALPVPTRQLATRPETVDDDHLSARDFKRIADLIGAGGRHQAAADQALDGRRPPAQARPRPRPARSRRLRRLPVRARRTRRRARPI